jgi:hypothetical protein
MIRSDFIACGLVLGAIVAIVGVLSTTLATTVTAQNTQTVPRPPAQARLKM